MESQWTLSKSQENRLGSLPIEEKPGDIARTMSSGDPALYIPLPVHDKAPSRKKVSWKPGKELREVKEYEPSPPGTPRHKRPFFDLLDKAVSGQLNQFTDSTPAVPSRTILPVRNLSAMTARLPVPETLPRRADTTPIVYPDTGDARGASSRDPGASPMYDLSSGAMSAADGALIGAGVFVIVLASYVGTVL